MIVTVPSSLWRQVSFCSGGGCPLPLWLTWRCACTNRSTCPAVMNWAMSARGCSVSGFAILVSARALA